MRVIRQVTEQEIPAYTEIAFNAYPSFKNFEPEAMNAYMSTAIEIMNHDPIVTFYGLFENDELIGVMRLFDFQMNAFGKIIPVSGLGFLGVHLLHKKKGVARDLVAFYETHYLNKSVPIATLLPFRPDFYKRMGYGHGTKMNQYKIQPSFIPKYNGVSNLKYLEASSLDLILACHSRVVQKSHGRMMKFGDEIRDLFGDPFNRVVGSFSSTGELTGYMVYQFKNGKAGNYTINHLYVKELIYENAEVLKQFLGYLRHQEEQIALVIFNTEDEHFHYLFNNPLNDTHNYIPYGYLETNTQAIGVMYKLLDLKMAFEQCAYRHYNHIKMAFKIEMEEDWGHETQELVVTLNGEGALLGGSEYDCTIRLLQSDLSALFLASTSVKGLYDLGLLTIDQPEYLEKLDLAFYYPQKPVCYTDF